MSTNQITICFTTAGGWDHSQTIPVIWCGENILEKTLSELHEEGCTDIKLVESAQEAR